MKKIISLLLATVMAFSFAIPCAFAEEEQKPNIYHYNHFTATKLSNPMTGEREADGLNGDRLNSYAWSMEELDDEYGRWVYIGSNRNILYASATSGLLGEQDPAFIQQISDTITNGELESSCSAIDFAHAVIVRYNLDTGEMQTWFDSADHGYMPPFGLVSGFRAVKEFKGKLYFNALASGATYIYRISGNDQTLPEVVYEHERGGFMRAMAVSEDGNTLYMGGTKSVMESFVETNDWAITVVKSETGDSFTPIADEKDFTRYEKAEYRTSGGDVWDMIQYNGDLYMTIMTMKGAMCFKGREVGIGAPGANEYGWKWEEFAGEDPDSPYGPGFGNPENYAMTPYLFNGDLYFIGFSNAMDAIIQSMIGLLTYVSGSGDINDFLDSLKYMEAVLDNETQIVRVKADGTAQMVVGDRDKCPGEEDYVYETAEWNKENKKPVEYIAVSKAGFNDADYSTTNYNWRAAIFDGKFYVGTFDSQPMFNYITKLTNGDLLRMNDDEFRQQLNYVAAFLEKLTAPKEEPPVPEAEIMLPESAPMMLNAAPLKAEEEPDINKMINEAAEAFLKQEAEPASKQTTLMLAAPNAAAGQIEEPAPPEETTQSEEAAPSKPSDNMINTLLDIIVNIRKGMDRQATTEFLENALLNLEGTIGKLCGLAHYLRFLERINPSQAVRASLAKVAELIENVCDILKTVDKEGIERYVRISHTLAENENIGCELYCTKDGVVYEPVTLDGFDDRFNYGVRTLLTVDDGVLVGTANPFFGAQLWKVTDDNYVPPQPPQPQVEVVHVTTYKINCGEGVKTNRKSASKNSTITLTLEDGYYTPVVTDKNGNVIELSEKSSAYTFKMPASEVTITATKVCPKDNTCLLSQFEDVVVDGWYHDGLHYCVENGIMKGIFEKIFDPYGLTTRATIVTMLWRMSGELYVNYAMSFEDLEDNGWYNEAVRWAQAEGIVTGYDDKTFGPNDVITREQLAVIIYRYAKYCGEQGFSGMWYFPLSYDDAADVSPWADEAVHWCTMNGILSGKLNNPLDPLGLASRAETATMVYRLNGLLGK